MKRVAALLVFVLALFAVRTSGQTTPQGSAPGNPGSSTSGRTLTIREAEAMALQRNPDITVGKLRALEAREFVRQTRSALYPTADLSLTGVGAEAGSRIAAGYLNNPVIYPRAAAGVSVGQLITDFGRTPNLVSSSEFQAKAEDQNAVATQQQIILAVDVSFYNTLETKALLHVAEETVNARQLLVDQVQALTNAKLKSDLDLSFSKVDLARARLLLLDSKNNYEAAITSLSAILGYPERQDFAPVEPVEQAMPPAPDAAPLIQQALQQRPEVKSLQDEITAATKFSKAEHELWWPTVSASGAVGLAPVRDEHISSWYGAAGVNINIPVFNGFLFSARAKSADLETERKRERLLSLQDNVARDVRNSWLDTEKTFERLTVTKQFQEQANLALQLADSRYKLGLGSIVEYSQAQLQKTDADLQDADAHYQYLVSQIVLAYQMGVTR
jgi:outer membrane protein